jgi:hypothetical protein
MRKIILVIALVANISLMLAVFNDYQPSARARAMSGAYTAVSDDANAVFYNPAGLLDTPFSAMVGMSQLSGTKFSELKTGAMAIPLPNKLGTLAVGAQVFDVDFEDTTLMAEQQWTVAHGFALLSDIHSTINVGWSANYYNLTFDEFGSDQAFGLNLGAKAIMHQRTTFGFSVSNLNQPKMGEANQHSLPRKLCMGVAYKPYDQVITTVEMKKDFAEDTEFMGGVEVKLFEPLAIRAGVHQNPATWSAGVSFKMIGVALDYSFTQHQVLDATHYLNIGYQFKGK